ncbi:hypothetical protein ACOMHN_035879 [Nucella lapillus]
MCHLAATSPNLMDLVFLVGTLLTSSITKDELAPCGYTAESSPRSSGSPGGGIAIIYRDCLSKHLTIKQTFSFNHSPFQLIQFSLTLQHGVLHLFCLY